MTELAWLLSCVVGKGLLERATSYKDKIAKGLEASMGLFNYPVLMAADILICRSTLVPVGKDQQQHVEMAQDMAASFNAAFGREVFVRPEWRFSVGAKVPGIDGEKMSKSYENTIPIFLPDDMTDKQAWKAYFASIKTDSKGVDDPKDPNDTLDDALSAARAGEGGGVRAGVREGRRRLRRAEEAIARRV